jgi:ABC-2 type transport system ATP-binding protein
VTAIAVDGLRKSYGAVEAVRGVSFNVEVGEVFGLLGPNGAGKTTTIEILEGYRKRDAGNVTVLGMDPQHGGRKLRERVGLVLQEAAVPPRLTVTELVELYRGYYPKPRPAAEIIELVGLGEKAKERVNKLSGGQQRRLDVALGLVGDPELIFLDEPTTGFDPSARRAAWEVVRNMRTLGKTIVLTTHYMDEAQYLADRICVIAAGKVVAEGTPETLRTHTEQRTHIRFEMPESLDAAAIPIAVTVQEGVATIATSTPTRSLRDLTTWAVAQGLELPNLEVMRPSLEDVYLELTTNE